MFLHQGEEDEEALFRADCKLWKLVVWQFVPFLLLVVAAIPRRRCLPGQASSI